MKRDKEDIWDLVSYDPVCNQVRQVAEVIADRYPLNIEKHSAELKELVLNETYDRLSRLESDIPAGNAPVSG